MPIDEHYARLQGMKRVPINIYSGKMQMDLEILRVYAQLWQVLTMNEKAVEKIRHEIH